MVLSLKKIVLLQLVGLWIRITESLNKDLGSQVLVVNDVKSHTLVK